VPSVIAHGRSLRRHAGITARRSRGHRRTRRYGWLVSYPAVPHSHVVPAGYLRAWAHGPKIAMRLAGSEQSVPAGVRDVGVRTNFYRRERPKTGEKFYDVEWSMQQAENAGLSIVRDLASRWPLGTEDKSCVAQLFALQHVRGPAFKAWHEGRIQPTIDALRSDPVGTTIPRPDLTPEEVATKVIENYSSDTRRLLRMIQTARAVGVAFGSMHWTLVGFTKPRLVTSDHPVVVWPLSRVRARPCPNDLNAGVTDTLEVFVPLGPDLLLLMTWLSGRDRPDVVRGAGRHIATANAFVVANADAQWFHELGVEPWRAAGARDPLSAELVAGYDVGVASGSTRRRDGAALATAEERAPLSNDPLPILTG
jgi:hypothetical protein